MTTRASADAIGAIPLFAGLTPAEREEITRVSELRTFPPGETVLQQGNQVQRLWLVLAGECVVTRKLTNGAEPLILATLGQGANFGEMSFFSPAPHSASVVAKAQLELMTLDRQNFDQLAQEQSSAAFKLAINIVTSVAERLRRMDDWVAELTTQGGASTRVSELARFKEKVFSGWTL